MSDASVRRIKLASGSSVANTGADVSACFCQDPALTTPWGLDRQRRLPWERALLLALPVYSHIPVSSHFRRTHAPLVVTLPAYSRATHTHTSGVLTPRSSFSRCPSRPAWSRGGPLTCLVWACCSRGICHARRGLVAVLSHALRGLVVLVVSITPDVVSSWSSHTPCLGSLSLWYPSRPAWSRRGPVTCLAWARCSRGIRHTQRGLITVLSHALCGLVVRLGVGGRSAGFTGRER